MQINFIVYFFNTTTFRLRHWHLNATFSNILVKYTYNYSFIDGRVHKEYQEEDYQPAVLECNHQILLHEFNKVHTEYCTAGFLIQKGKC